MMANSFTIGEIEEFVKDHIQSKIEHKELRIVGFDADDSELFEKELRIYKIALLEGVCNGIVMCGGNIEGIEFEQ